MNKQNIVSDNYAGMTLRDEVKKRSRKSGISNFSGETFIDERNEGMNIQIKLENKSDVDKRIALFAGDLESVEEIASVVGITVDAIAKEGAVISESETPKVICTAKNLAYLQRFIKRNPTRISKLQLTTDDQGQFNNEITVSKVSPAQKLGTQAFVPMTYKNPGDQSEKMVVIDFKHLQLDDQTVLDVVIAAGRTLYLSFFFGASNNAAYTLDAQARELIGD